jgi:hypothetical protein
MSTTWRKEIEAAMKTRKDSWASDTICTLDDEGLDKEFDDGFGGVQGKEFTLWTQNYVYFPVCYAGAEWCDSVPRNPGFPHGKPTKHVGGG